MSSHGWAINAFRLIQMVIVLCPLGQVTGQEESKTQSPAQVLQDLLIRHGDNSTITVPQLRALLELLSQGQKKGDGDGSTAQSPATTSTRANISRVRLLKKTLYLTPKTPKGPKLYGILPCELSVVRKCYNVVRKINSCPITLQMKTHIYL